MSNNKEAATVQALLAFVNLQKNEEREFIVTMNLLLRASPKRRREIIAQLQGKTLVNSDVPGRL
ncbi:MULTISPECIES: hypothetical protein [unclassified Paraburkholderia]|uniref:hypothetical protein n=1 Tax=unclassified Paraburkholderia TaxID=2615204 RepID=UPI00161B3A7E|nr:MULTISPECIES: hypothetical protein [unclassified Paraburkholderia]MBB5447992.1 hypothetical protein [Paraburkholderia sp. WSM4177]MBB5488397.1 hypothetical protein [Paraburkholderia sp. WSM4180]